MGFRHVYAPDAAVGADVGLQTGLGSLRTQAQQLALQEQARQAALDESARQFDIGASMRARSEYLQGQRYAQSQAAQLAAQQQSLAAQAYQQQQQQAFTLDRDARQAGYAQDQAMLQSDLMFQRQDSMLADNKVAMTMKELRGLELDPDGQAALKGLQAKVRTAQENMQFLRPEAKAAVYDSILSDIYNADIWQYENKSPTTSEEFGANLTPLQGQVIADPSNPPPGFYRQKVVTGTRTNWETVFIPDPQKPFITAPNGEQLYLDPAQNGKAIPVSKGGGKSNPGEEIVDPDLTGYVGKNSLLPVIKGAADLAKAMAPLGKKGSPTEGLPDPIDETAITNSMDLIAKIRDKHLGPAKMDALDAYSQGLRSHTETPEARNSLGQGAPIGMADLPTAGLTQQTQGPVQATPDQQLQQSDEQRQQAAAQRAGYTGRIIPSYVVADGREEFDQVQIGEIFQKNGQDFLKISATKAEPL